MQGPFFFVCLTNQPYPCQLMFCKQSTPVFWLEIVPTFHQKHLVLMQLKWHQKFPDISFKLPRYWLQIVPTSHLNEWSEWLTHCHTIVRKDLQSRRCTEASASCRRTSCRSPTEKSDRHWLDFGIGIQKTTNYTPVLLTRIWQKKAAVLRYILEETIESDNPVSLMTYSIWSWNMDPALDTVIVLLKEGGSLPSRRDWCRSSSALHHPFVPKYLEQPVYNVAGQNAVWVFS